MRKPLPPSLVLAFFGALSGALGTQFLSLGIGTAPHPGLYMVLTGLWFGLVMAFGIWRWGCGTPAALLTAAASTWAGWELAINLALLFEHPPLSELMNEPLKSSVTGFLSGALGSLATWAGVAAFTPRLRNPHVTARFVMTGAALGLLLPVTNHYDDPIILLLPWQCGVAAVLGWSLRPEPVRPTVANGFSH